MISRFHVYRYANCMLLYNINTLHHRDDGTFSRINFKDASLVGLPAPRHRLLFRATDARLCPCTNEILLLCASAESVRLNRRRVSNIPQMFRDSSFYASCGRRCSTWSAYSRGILLSLYRRTLATKIPRGSISPKDARYAATCFR